VNHSKKTIVFIALAVCVAAAIAAFASVGNRTYHQTRFLKDIFSATYADLQIVSGNRFSSTDASRAWHVRFKQDSASLPTTAVRADASDIQFAIQQVEALLGKSLRGLVSPSVHRMEAAGRDAYLVRDGLSRDVYVYVFVN
jgi:hypothetical protein